MKRLLGGSSRWGQRSNGILRLPPETDERGSERRGRDNPFATQLAAIALRAVARAHDLEPGAATYIPSEDALPRLQGRSRPARWRRGRRRGTTISTSPALAVCVRPVASTRSAATDALVVGATRAVLERGDGYAPMRSSERRSPDSSRKSAPGLLEGQAHLWTALRLMDATGVFRLSSKGMPSHEAGFEGPSQPRLATHGGQSSL